MPLEGLSKLLELFLPHTTSPTPVPHPGQPRRLPGLVAHGCTSGAHLGTRAEAGEEPAPGRALAGASLLLLCCQPVLSTPHWARSATKKGQDLGLATSLLPPLTWSVAQKQRGWFPP